MLLQYYPYDIFINSDVEESDKTQPYIYFFASYQILSKFQKFQKQSFRKYFSYGMRDQFYKFEGVNATNRK